MNESELLSTDIEDNYVRFIDDAIATGCVWGLERQEGDWALCESLKSEDVDAMPLWSQPEFAQAHCVNEWAEYRPVPIALEEFLDDWLTGMHEDVLLVGTNWTLELEGMEHEPLDLLEDFDSAASEAS